MKTEVPFKHINGNLYKLIDGVIMGSPLGLTFMNFYMGDIEEKVFKDKTIIPDVRLQNNLDLQIRKSIN